MKTILPITLLIILVCSGCSSTYRITLNNGDTLTARGKPVYNPAQGRYYYKNAHGEADSISASNIREIAPASRKDKDGPEFLK